MEGNKKENKVAILQPNYIPWKGVFDMINMVDTFVFFDDVDFTKRDWRTRNKIKTAQGSIWLSVPVNKNSRGDKIYEIIISNHENWQEKHYKSIVASYKQSKYFEKYHPLLEKIYLNEKWENLSEFNIYVTRLIAELLGIDTVFYNSRELNVEGIKDDRLISICEKLKATEYLSGPAAKDYIRPEIFQNKDISLSYIKYEYKEYKQLYGDFDHFVTVLDVLFNCGDDAKDFIFEGKKEVINKL